MPFPVPVSEPMNKFLLLPLLAAATLTAPLFADVSGEELAKRQCRSVHMNHGDIPEGSQALYVEATALKSAPGTYFCAANFNDGYIGFQERADGHKWLIFSVWDPVAHGDNPNDVPEAERSKLVDAGKEVKTGRFGGEGTGGQSFLDYDWKTGENMKFLVVKKTVDEKMKQISGYFFNNKTKKWELISCWKTHQSPRELSFAASFVEDFRRNYESAKKPRSASYGPLFAYSKEGKWVESRSGTFTADPTPSNAVRADINAAHNGISITTGGDTQANPDFPLWKKKSLPENMKRTSPPDEAVLKLVTAPLMQEQPDIEERTKR